MSGALGRYSLRAIKLAILQALSHPSTTRENKRNLLGLMGQPGGLEHRLETRFTPEERHLAVRAFDELRVASLIRPTYSDLVSPEDWVELTNAGRRALERRALDSLDEALQRIHPGLIDKREGAWSALGTGLPDALCQAAHSARELIDQTLKEGAPDNLVKAQDGFRPDTSSSSGITRRHRLKYLMRSRRESFSESDLKVADKACELVEAIDEKLKAYAHARSPLDEDAVRNAIEVAELALRYVLLPGNP